MVTEVGYQIIVSKFDPHGVSDTSNFFFFYYTKLIKLL